MSKNIRRIIITCGDPNGIGPEVTLKALKKLPATLLARIVLAGCFQQLEEENTTNGEPLPLERVKSIEFHYRSISIPVIEPESAVGFFPHYGKISARAGAIAGEGIKLGIQACQSGITSALVTAPACKESLHLSGYKFPGQTEMLAELTGTSEYIMVLATGKMRVGMATTHHALGDVTQILSEAFILRKIKALHHALVHLFGEKDPMIAVCALNPHASDGGIFGNEEAICILPAIRTAQKEGCNALGPFPADTLYPDYKKYSGILAMYHDQGMIPIKMLGFGHGVNVTGGLPFPRTSPDHGTAFDIAGKSLADASSMLAAIKLAFKMTKPDN